MGELADYLQQHSPEFRKARIAALYSDFRAQRTLNPDGFRANIAAWRSALSLLVSSGSISKVNSASSNFILKLDESVLRSLEDRRFGQPLALGVAVREAIAERSLVHLQQFRKAKTDIHQRNWSEFSWAVGSWALRTLGVIDPARDDDKLPMGTYVLMDNLDTACAIFKQDCADLATRYAGVFTKPQFHQKFSALLGEDRRLSNTDLDVFLQFLSRDKGLIVYDGAIIRLMGTGAESVKAITEEDKSIASMKELIANLGRQTTLLNVRIDELNQKAKAAVIKGNRISAIGALKSKKIAESALAARYATLNQLEVVSAKIEQATDNLQLAKVIESSASLLTSLNKQVGGPERIGDVMDMLREEIASTDEVSAILAEGTGVVVDEEELDNELDVMERAEKDKMDEQKASTRHAKEQLDLDRVKGELGALPDVPVREISREQNIEQAAPAVEKKIANLSLN